MKASVTPAATARVMRDIAEAVRPVEHARTAAAVERVLRTASRGCSESFNGWLTVTQPLLEQSAFDYLGDMCEWCVLFDEATDEVVGLHIYYLDAECVPDDERRRYAPWNVSPHLFEDGA